MQANKSPRNLIIILCCIIAAGFAGFNLASNQGWIANADGPPKSQSQKQNQNSDGQMDDADYIIKGKGEKGHFEINVELAQTAQQRSQGLMHRTEMAENAGMLFRFDDSRMVQMWMRNTPLSLDMVFIDEQGVVKHVARNTLPFSENIISSRFPVRYVLEINAGVGEKLGIKRGMQLLHPWFLENAAK